MALAIIGKFLPVLTFVFSQNQPPTRANLAEAQKRRAAVAVSHRIAGCEDFEISPVRPADLLFLDAKNSAQANGLSVPQ
jgi:hypothetical protein